MFFVDLTVLCVFTAILLGLGYMSLKYFVRYVWCACARAHMHANRHRHTFCAGMRR